ncbi:MAG: redox-regulated ATPase YchF [Thiotrichales bacterium]|nr:redox-regulated ATPase YchF [Thiotrichales bacterium]
MNIRCGIVGLPNVGKSTLYNALTSATAAAENYPFCTIEPNVGVVPVSDPRLGRIAAIVRPERTVPAAMEFVDIAGLVAGASRGEGLGNRFLSHVRETKAIAHVVRCFESGDVVHVSGRVSPLDDIETIETELLLADLEQAERARDRAAKTAKAGDREARAREALMTRAHAHLAEGHPLRTLELGPEEAAMLASLSPLTAKPVLYVANVAEDGFGTNALAEAVEARAHAEGAAAVRVSAAVEAELSGLDEAERAEYLATIGIEEPGLARVVRAAGTLLGLQTFFTAGPKETRAWTLRRGSTAAQAAGVIHSDFERGFIRAEVVGYEDFVALGGEQGAKAAGRWRLEGRDYIVAEGDVMHFRFAV